MALSGSTSLKISNTSSTPNDYLVLSWTVNSQSVANNTSNITVALKAYSTYGSGAQPWNLVGNTVRLTVGGSQKVNDTNASIDFRGTSSSNPATLATWTGNVTHNSDGSLSLALVGYINYNDTETSHSGLPGAHTINATANINTIARASQPTCPSTSTFGNVIKVTTNRASSSFTHTLVFKIGSNTYTKTGVSSDYSFTIPSSWAPSSSSSATLTVTCTTYSGSSNIGSKTCSSTVSVPSSWAPSVVISYTKTNPADNGDVLAKVTTVNLTATATPASGASISSYSWSGAVSGSGATKTHVPQSIGKQTYTVTVTDSRGLMKSHTISVTASDAASTFSKDKTSLNFGQSITVSITNKRKSSFTHDISYTIGSVGVVTESGVSSGSRTTTIPTSAASAIPRASSATMTITLTTRNGGTAVGTSSQTVQINVPSSWLPTIGSVTDTGVNKFGNLYLQNVSKTTIKVNNAKASTGATIVRYEIKGQNLNYTGTSASATSDILTASGSKTYTVLVADSRGRTVESSITITVTAYSFPTLTMTGHRCSQDGTANDFGNYIIMHFSGSWSAVTGNKWNIVLKYRHYPTSDSYTTIQTISNQTGSINIDSNVHAATVDYAWEIVATLTDTVGKSASYTVNLSTGRVLMDHYKDRLNTFHRPASQDLLNDLENPDLANVFAGETWFEGPLRGRAAGYNSRNVYLIPYLTPGRLGLASNPNLDDYYQALLKWICVNYPNVPHGTWIGALLSTSSDTVIIRIFNTATVNASGAPQYAHMLVTRYTGDLYMFGYSNYVWYSKEYASRESGTWTPQIYDSNTYKYSLAADSATWYKSGDIILCRGEYSNFTPSSAISTMFKIHGFPTMRVLGGTFYLAGLSGSGGDRTIQASTQGLYLRPNIKLTSGTNYGILAFSFYGV